MIRSRKLEIFSSLVVVVALSLSGCSTQNIPARQAGYVVSCDSITTNKGGSGPVLDCLDGSARLDISAVKGPLIINVWGSWCAPCKEEIPYFRNFYAKNKDVVQILGVDVEEASIKDGKGFVVSEGMTWPHLYDPDGRSRAFFGMGVPVTWFVDGAGQVVFKKIGVLKNENELKDLTAKYLNIAVS